MIKIPEWLAKMPKRACIGVDEFADALNISKNSLRSRLYQEHKDMPKPDFNSKHFQSKGRTKIDMKTRGSLKWEAVTVRNYIRHLNRLEKQGESK